MKVSYKGIKKDLPEQLQAKLDTKFAKLSKLIDGRGEKRAHVIVTGERHLHKAEVTVHTRHGDLIGMGSDAELFNAISGALSKIEKQAMKQGAKFRATTRRAEPRLEPMKGASANSAAVKAPAESAAPRIFRPNHHERRKPITLEEAMLEMEDGRDYLVYRDADKQSVFMLVRRRDGHFDLIES